MLLGFRGLVSPDKFTKLAAHGDPIADHPANCRMRRPTASNCARSV